jgi:hypothetical protein
MKNTQNNKTFKFSDKAENLDFYVIGISSVEKIYKISWQLNNILGIELSLSDDFSKNSDSENSYSVFSGIFEDLNKFFLIENKNIKSVLSSKYKNIDYFFILSTETELFNISNISERLIKSKLFQGVFVIESCKDLKNTAQVLISF